jgi:hypothetical protein
MPMAVPVAEFTLDQFFKFPELKLSANIFVI